MRKSIRIPVSNLIFGLYVYFSVVAQRSILAYITLAGFISYTMFNAFIKRKIKLMKMPLYFILEIIFILYCIWQNKSGISVNVSASQSQVKTLLIGLAFGISLFYFIRLKGDIKPVLKTYVFSCCLGILTLSLFYYRTILQGRFSAANTINVFGIAIGQQSATSLAYIIGQALFFSVLLYWNEKKDKRKCYFYIIYFTSMMILTGTRKVLLIAVGAFIFVTYFKSNKKNAFKLYKNIILLVVLGIIAYFIVMKVDFIYQIIGSRIEGMISYLLKGEINETSLSSRVKFINRANNAIVQKPYYGWGLDSFRTVLNDEGLYTHNNFLEILVSCGYVGFIIYYLKYGYIIFKLLYRKFKGSKKNKLYINSFLILFIILWVLEYWQITFIYRTFMISNLFILGYLELRNQKYK